MIGVNNGVKKFDNQMDHVVAIKGYKKEENGKLMLHIRDSARARDPENPTEFWIENKMTNEPDQWNLAFTSGFVPRCMYFEFV